MNERILGRVKRVNGPVIEAKGITDARMLELVMVGESRLIGEVIKLSGQGAVIQVYEDTTGLAPNDPVYGTGMPLSLELGPGLLGTIYDGIQRPLTRLLELSGRFIERGISAESLDREKLWDFEPVLREGDEVAGGEVLGRVPETSRIEHRVCVPPDVAGRIVSIAPPGSYRVDEEIAVVETVTGQRSLSMMQRWPIRSPRPVRNRRPLDVPLITGQRVIDTLFPLAKGGTVAIPGGFGTGKTMTQHAIAKWCDADIIV
ncbi:MAG: V-type ATP synthase subunit A, partial [Spirochaetales bacterium]|nr:V-type ATP synthase subunit A [Spirochaetales bacterium]